MKLATVDALREDLGFGSDMTDFAAAADEALEAATTMLAARLDTEFDQATITDYFYVATPGYLDGVNFDTEFRLSRGLLSSLTSFAYAPSMAQFGTVDAVDVTAVIKTNKEKGVLRDLATPYDKKFVSVTYVAGFLPAAAYPDAYDAAVVPKWLQSAAKTQAKIFLVDNPSLENASVKLDGKMLATMLATLTSRYVRYAPTALLPL
jgi:hypothetical protein